jgi:predicted TIM-barrel fold metal-dependent hydrolase
MPMPAIAQGNRDTVSDMPQKGTKLRTITLEEHFASPGFLAGPGREFIERIRNTGPRGAKIMQQLQDVGDGRLAEMDAAGVDRAVIVPPTWAGDSNDWALDLAAQYPKRFAVVGRFDAQAPCRPLPSERRCIRLPSR